ncbi:MAG TPA: DUF4177 domain-containing protein [Rhodobacteraceae bacterium]|nr:DUF4177 domain-containing protein [Paracoccaceae bacterium]
MPTYEFKVVPAPKKGLKGKGVKGTEGKFANALMQIMNELGKDGWEYLRADTLPCEERSGMMGKSTTFLNMLVFRREIPAKTQSEEKADNKPALSVPGKAETVAQTHAPLLQGADTSDSGKAPALGPATESGETAPEPTKGSGNLHLS